MREDKMDSRWGLCWALLFVPALHCTGFSVSQPQGQMEAEESSNVTLVCVMSSETPLGPARWYKCAGSERTHFYSGAPKGGDKIDPRVTWTVNNTLLNYSITIRDLRINDTGEYYCEKYTKGENENKPYASGPGVKLTVRGFPVIHGPTSRVQVGATVNLSCEAAGSSATEIEWKKNDSKLTSNTESSLVSLVVNKSDIKSVIECQVSGFPKLSTTYSMNSIIMVFPEMTISGEPSLVLGQSATFNCSVSGFYPSAFNVSWVINNNSMMHEGANVKENDDGTFTESKTITLTATEEYHHRQLICQASHEGFEKVQKSVILSVRAHPTITGKPHRVESERNLTLICDSKGDKNTTITWQKNGAHIAEGHTETWENGSRNILVMKIEKEDLGSWISCQIPGYGRDKVLSAHLNISDFLIVHPNVTIHENPKLILGQVANFTCWIREFYPRNISLLWSNGSTSMESSDEVMENEDGTFTARSCITFNVREEHRGNQLKCQATFQGSESVESTVTLGVRAQPVITGHLQRIKEGDKVTLSCTSKGDTDTDVTWLKNENLQVRGRSEAWSDGSNSSFTWTFGMPDITSNISCLIPGYERDKMSHTVNISDYIIVLPNLVIKKEVLSQNNQFTRVTCFVEQFYPQNISMELLWESPSEKFYRNETHKNADGTFSTSASLEIEVGEAAIPVSCRTRYQGMNLSSLTINVTDERHHEKTTHMMTSFIILAAVLIGILALAGLVTLHFIRRAHRKSTSGDNRNVCTGPLPNRQPENPASYATVTDRGRCRLLEPSDQMPDISGPTGFTDTQKTSLETYVTYAELDVKNFENRKKAKNNENLTEYAEIRVNVVQREEDENDEANYANLDSLNRNRREGPMASATQQSEHTDYAVVHFHRRTQAKS